MATRVKTRNMTDVEDFIKIYYTGELQQKIIRNEQQLRRQFPDFYYDNLSAYKMTFANVSKSGYTDPTGELATKLAMIDFQRREIYYFLKKINDTISSLLEGINQNEEKILKSEFNITDKTLREVAAEIEGMGYNSVRKKGKELKELFRAEISKIIQREVTKI